MTNDRSRDLSHIIQIPLNFVLLNFYDSIIDIEICISTFPLKRIYRVNGLQRLELAVAVILYLIEGHGRIVGMTMWKYGLRKL